jgi:hypothetical protein
MQRGRAGCLLVVGLAAIGLAVVLALAATRPYRTLAPVAHSADASNSATQKLLLIAASGVTAQADQQPVPFSETFSDEELTSFIGDRMPPGGLVTDLTVRAGTGNLIEGTATGHLGAVAIPLYFRATAAAENRHPAFHVTESRAGLLGVPVVFDSVLTGALQNVPLVNQVLKVQDLKMTTGAGRTTISGTAIP